MRWGTQVDVADEAAVAGWVASAEAAFGGPVFALVNSAGGTGGYPTSSEVGFEPIESLTNSKFTRLFEINVLGVVNTTKAVVPVATHCGTPTPTPWPLPRMDACTRNASA